MIAAIVGVAVGAGAVAGLKAQARVVKPLGALVLGALMGALLGAAQSTVLRGLVAATHNQSRKVSLLLDLARLQEKFGEAGAAEAVIDEPACDQGAN